MAKHPAYEKTSDIKNESRCKALNKKGQPCRAAATESGFCYLHTDPKLAAKLGRVGGRGNRHIVEGTLNPLPPLNNVAGVLDATAQMIAAVYARTLHPRIAAGAAPLLNTLLKALATQEEGDTLKKLEEKINKLEIALAQRSSPSSGGADDCLTNGAIV